MPLAYTDERPLRLGVLISGGGSTLANLVERVADGRLRRVRIGLVISSRADVRGVEIARAAGLPLAILRRRDYSNERAYGAAVAAACDAARIDLAVMAGFLCLWRYPAAYADRILNIHPALLPAFGGPGMFGHHVHAAVLNAKAAESGCTVHIVDEQYDHGPIVAQVRVPVQPDDTVETLAARVQAAERELYPQVIQRVADEGLVWLSAAGRS
jgi:formyltetrahydrofolate-dependent phosphoribosylglycinamide formyltransferase